MFWKRDIIKRAELVYEICFANSDILDTRKMATRRARLRDSLRKLGYIGYAQIGNSQSSFARFASQTQAYRIHAKLQRSFSCRKLLLNILFLLLRSPVH